MCPLNDNCSCHEEVACRYCLLDYCEDCGGCDCPGNVCISRGLVGVITCERELLPKCRRSDPVGR